MQVCACVYVWVCMCVCVCVCLLMKNVLFTFQLLMMSEVFEQYCNGIKNSFRLLAELKNFEEFSEFLQDPPLERGQLTICGFIQKPLEHIKHLVLNLQEILSLTSLEHQDMDNLSQVIESK